MVKGKCLVYAQGMSKRLLLLVLLPFLLAADVYKTEAEDGTVEYSDRPQDLPDRLDLVPLSSVRPPSTARSQQSPSAKASTPTVSAQGIRIQSPGNDEAIRSNDGGLTVIVKLASGLLKANQHIELELDKRRLTKHFQETRIRLYNLDRGSHVLQALLVDNNGLVLARTAPTRFHLLRYSILNPP